MDRLRTLIWLRFLLSKHKFVRQATVIDTSAAFFLMLIISALSVALAFAVSMVIHSFSSPVQEEALYNALRIIFFVVLVFGQILPVLFAVGSQSFEPSRFLLLPLKKQTLYGIMHASSVFDYWHLFYLPSLCVLGATILKIYGISKFLSLIIIFLFLALNIIWSNVIILALQGIMRQRRLKEIITITAMLLLFIISFGPSLLERGESSSMDSVHPVALPLINFLEWSWWWFPSSTAAAGVFSNIQSATSMSLFTIMLLLIQSGVGFALGWWVFNTFALGEVRGLVLKSKRSKKAFQSDLLGEIETPPLFPRESWAITVKDILYYFRSVFGRIQLVGLTLLTAFFCYSFSSKLDNDFLFFQPVQLLFFGLLLYGGVVVSGLTFNTFAWDGRAIVTYLVLPISAKRLLLGKNGAIWLISGLYFLIICIIFQILIKALSLRLLIQGGLIFINLILVNTTIGNFMSMLYPKKVNISQFKQLSSSPITTLTNLACNIGNSLILSLSFLAASLFSVPALKETILLGLTLCYSIGYFFSLNYVASMLVDRREKIVTQMQHND